MKAFSFSLQKLLDAKVALEQAEEAKLGRALHSLELTKTALREILKKIDSESSRSETTHKCTTNSNELDIHNKYITWLKVEKEEQLQEISSKTQIAEEIRVELMNWVRERKTLESLMEKERHEWVLNVKHEEMKQMDEFATVAYLNQRKTA